jgi:hypothetical protein
LSARQFRTALMASGMVLELWTASGSDPLARFDGRAALRRRYDSAARGYVVELPPPFGATPRPSLSGAALSRRAESVL